MDQPEKTAHCLVRGPFTYWTNDQRLVNASWHLWVDQVTRLQHEVFRHSFQPCTHRRRGGMVPGECCPSECHQSVNQRHRQSAAKQSPFKVAIDTFFRIEWS